MEDEPKDQVREAAEIPSQPEPWNWTDAEQPLAFGYGAHHKYGSRFEEWDDELEAALRSEWEAAEACGAVKHAWEEVRERVRQGFDRAALEPPKFPVIV